MRSIPGPAPIVDFDGTLALLPVDWDALRRRLSVATIDDLWRTGADLWRVVTEVEVAAAEDAAPVPATVEALAGALGFAVISANSEQSISIFLRRHPALAGRARLVVGRETMQGPKRDPACFERAFVACRDATAGDRGDGPVVYVGDQNYELVLATSLGATAVHVDELR